MTELITNDEVRRFRSETAGTRSLIHFNNAGSSLPPDVVVETITEYLRAESRTGGYEMETASKEILDGVYGLIARLINADQHEIAITENASTAWGIAFNGIDFNENDEIITSEMEYVTGILGFIQAKKSKKIRVKVLPVYPDGSISIEQLENYISSRTRLIAITHISSSNGLVLPVDKIGDVARRHQILYLVDACQSIGQMPVDVQNIKCDMLSATGRKYLRGPRGTGFLYIRKDVQDMIQPPIMDSYSIKNYSLDDYKLKEDARRYETFEKSRALTVGLGKAVSYALDIGLESIWQRISTIAQKLRNDLKEVEGIVVHDIGEIMCGIVTFSAPKIDSTTLKKQLADKGINISIATAAATLVFMEKNRLNQILRASLHYYNTEEEINIFVSVLRNILAKS